MKDRLIQDKGYTLLEVLLSLVIIIIIMTMSSRLLDLAAYSKLRNSSHEVISKIKLAKEYAKTAQKEYEVAFDYTNNSYCIIDIVENKVINEWKLGFGIRFDPILSNYSSSRRLKFYPSGFSNLNGSIFLKDERGRTFRIVIFLGRIRLERY